MIGKYEFIYDISVALGAESIDHPTIPKYSRELVLKLKDGQHCNLSRLVMCTHSGTHIDTPSHFVPDGKTLDDYPADKWILPAQVVNIEHLEAIYPSELEGLGIRAGNALLFKTNNSKTGRCASGVFSEDYVFLSPEAADFCVRKKVGLVGIDYVTVDRHADSSYTAHHILLGNGIRILESINLKDVPPGRYTLICLPLKIEGAEGAPSRAILLR